MSKTICKACKNEIETTINYKSEITIKGKKIEVEGPRRVCANCHNLKFDLELDNAFSQHAINTYNKLYGFTGEKLVELRNEFGVSQETFGKVLGIAKKTIVQYENNRAIPNDVYVTMLKSIENDKNVFFKYANINVDNLTEFEKKRVFEKQANLLPVKFEPLKYILKEEGSAYTGYSVPSKEKIVKLVQYLVSRVQGKTKLAKSLFFIDALYYTQTAQSMTGLQYAAINNGPIPDKFDSLLEYLIDEKKISQTIKEDGSFIKYIYHSLHDVSLDDFDELEKKIINEVIHFVKNKTATKLSDLSHELEAWQQASTGELITFDALHDFSLTQWKMH